jgi:Arc/MetJ family transcription regulator
MHTWLENCWDAFDSCFSPSEVVGQRCATTRPGFCARIHLWMCIVWCMRTNIEIDDRVLHEAQELIGARTKREAVDVALRELVARHRRIGVLDLRGRVRWEGDLDESRRGRS